ncbi:MAG: hypothetical protein LQ340_003594 [Diploschistes diacapsis]|nr:MAG: hypothetical protein LQ340_003594 [Diploschistes diacapsis]
MESIKNAANYVSDKAQETTAGASKEANKNVAKDSDASLGTRASAGKDAVSDKMSEHGHGASATLNKEEAKH